jgi:hypothetical protein
MVKRAAIKLLKIWLATIEAERRLHLRCLCAVSPEAGRMAHDGIRGLRRSMLSDAQRRYCELEAIDPGEFQARR